MIGVQLDALSSIAMEELNSLMAKFIAFTSRQRDKGNHILESGPMD